MLHCSVGLSIRGLEFPFDMVTKRNRRSEGERDPLEAIESWKFFQFFLFFISIGRKWKLDTKVENFEELHALLLPLETGRSFSPYLLWLTEKRKFKTWTRVVDCLPVWGHDAFIGMQLSSCCHCWRKPREMTWEYDVQCLSDILPDGNPKLFLCANSTTNERTIETTARTISWVKLK